MPAIDQETPTLMEIAKLEKIPFTHDGNLYLFDQVGQPFIERYEALVKVASFLVFAFFQIVLEEEGFPFFTFSQLLSLCTSELNVGFFLWVTLNITLH